MKCFLWIVGVCVMVGVVFAAVTETTTTGTKSTDFTSTRSTATNYTTLKKISVVIDATDLDSTVIEALDSTFGIVFRITIVTSGSDAAYTIVLRDESNITIFTKTLNSSSSEDFTFAIYEDDTEGNPWAGVMVGGVMDLIITNAADLTGLTVNVYYIDFWR